MNTHVHSATAGYTIGAIVAIIANTLLVWVKETNPTLLALMKSLIHHWLIHGVVILLVFLALGLLFSRWPRKFNGASLALLLTLATTIAGAGIVGFYLFIG